MQQDPFLHAPPNLGQQPTQPLAPPAGGGGGNIPNITRGRGGWYPRWWIIAAFCCSVIVIVFMILWHPLICPDQQISATRPIVCAFTQWADIWQVALIWLLMLVLWLLALIFGMGAVEIPSYQRSDFGEILRAVSEFGPVHILIIIQGLIALPAILILWYLERSTPLAFAFLSIAVFLANCAFFQRIAPAERRGWLIGYGAIAVALFFAEYFFKPGFRARMPPNSEWPLLAVQFLLIAVAIIAIFRRPPPDPNLSAQDLLQQNIREAATPGYVLRSTWPFSRLFPPRPLGGGGNQNNGGNQP